MTKYLAQKQLQGGRISSGSRFQAVMAQKALVSVVVQLVVQYSVVCVLGQEAENSGQNQERMPPGPEAILFCWLDDSLKGSMTSTRPGNLAFNARAYEEHSALKP